jgi:hypothetical protein
MNPDQTDKLVAALDKISKRLTVISIAQEVQAELLTAFFSRVDYYLQVNHEDTRNPDQTDKLFANPTHNHSGSKDARETEDMYYDINGLVNMKWGKPANEIDLGSSDEFLREDDKEWREELEKLEEADGFTPDEEESK